VEIAGLSPSKTQGCLRIHHFDSARAIAIVIDHHVAWQQQADAEIGAECAVRQARVARAEDYVLAETTSSLAFMVCLTSISVKTPKPCAWRATRVRSTACSYGRSIVVPKP
jgi:hypothetical protein